jgi:F0F1-type ATP synthase delta subunit
MSKTKVSKIVKYKVEEDVINMRRAGLTYEQIAEDLNASGKIPPNDRITIDNVSTFLDKIPEVKRSLSRNSQKRIIKALNQSFDIIYEVNNLFEKTKNLLDQMEQDAEMKGKFVNPYQFKAVSSEMRELLAQMIEIQKEINDYKNIQRFMEVILETLYQEVPDKIPIIIEKLKEIKETKWFSDILDRQETDGDNQW